MRTTAGSSGSACWRTTSTRPTLRTGGTWRGPSPPPLESVTSLPARRAARRTTPHTDCPRPGGGGRLVGMSVAARSYNRTACAARSSLNKALQIALRGGAVSGLFVVAMSLFGVGLLYTVLEALHFEPTKIPLMIVGYGFGASFVALFAQLGGGIYTKAADVGADLVGKVEAGIPEDDPRNPAAVPDRDGAKVGQSVGRGASHFR